MKTFFKLLLVGAALSASLANANGRGQDGWPLPWPFPWAKECPMDWNHLGGTYSINDSHSHGQLLVKVSVLTQKGIRLVRISHYSSAGLLMFDGTTTVTAKQKIVSLYLDGVQADSPRIWAMIKMHYDSSVFSCAENHLVPILTVQALDQDAPREGIDYRMTKVD